MLATLTMFGLCLCLCRTSAMGCRGVKSVWFAKFFSCPSGNSETHTVPHTNTPTYTHAHQKKHCYMLQERDRHYLVHTVRKRHAQDRMCTRYTKLTTGHAHRKTHIAHKVCTFQNTYVLKNRTKGKKLPCLMIPTHPKKNAWPTHFRICKHNQKCVQRKWHTLNSTHTYKKMHTCFRRTLCQPGHYAHIKQKQVCHYWTPNTLEVVIDHKELSKNTQWRTRAQLTTDRHWWARLFPPGHWGHTLPAASGVSITSTLFLKLNYKN